jgi:hypothetical protein
MPRVSTDGSGDRFTFNDLVIDAGDHGGAAGCESVLAQTGAMTVESTACSWMTSTTIASITYLDKPDNQMMVFGTGPETLGPIMRRIRDQVEKLG